MVLPYSSSPSPSPSVNPDDPITPLMSMEHCLLFIFLPFSVIFSCFICIHKKLWEQMSTPSGARDRRSSISMIRWWQPRDHRAATGQPPRPVNEVGLSIVERATNYCSQCAICLKDFAFSDTFRVIPTCNHTFHASCIDDWSVVNKTCPICRSLIPSG